MRALRVGLVVVVLVPLILLVSGVGPRRDYRRAFVVSPVYASPVYRFHSAAHSVFSHPP